MINLLPPEMKHSYKYARFNRHLLHWIAAFFVGIVGACALTAIGYIYLQRTADNYRSQIATSQQQLKDQKYTTVKTQVKDITNNLQLVVQVLSNQVVFSELIKQIGTLTPTDTNLTGLAISQTEGALDITAQAKDYSAATQLHINLSDKNNQLFSRADIVSISCQKKAASAYPCTVTIRALFAPNNPFLFINKSTGVKV